MTDYTINKIPHYTESIFYELKQTARVMKFHAEQQFSQLGIDLTPEEYSILDTVMCNPELCQRDLAKLLLLDRANTGRILNKLEERKFITRRVDTKNNRLVKKVIITKQGIKELDNINNKIMDRFLTITEKIPPEEFESVKLSIRQLRINLEKHIENKI
jgi:DNA-binding MarR family transcriptional regulator